MLEGLLAFERMTMALLKEAHEHNNHKVVFWVCIEPNNMGDKVFHYNCNIVIVINYYICFCFFVFLEEFVVKRFWIKVSSHM
jgi:hypothetical protein